MQECLLLQIEKKVSADKAVILAANILRNQFDALTNKHYNKIIQKYDIEEEDLKDALEVISKLSPKVGGNFDTQTITINQEIIPDFVIQVKSPYEGNYTSNGYFYHPTSSRILVNLAKTLVKSGTFGVTVDLGDLGGSGYKAILTVDPVTNAVTVTPAPGAAGTPYTMFTSGLPTTNPGYTGQWVNSSSCNNTYDPVTKTFKVRYGYMGGDGWRVTEEFIKKN